MTSWSVGRFDALIHSPVRLRICGLLRTVQQLEFAVVRDALEVTDAHLSKNLKVLADAGYIDLRKERATERGGARPRTWIGLTAAGRNALESHLTALTQIAEGGPVGP